MLVGTASVFVKPKTYVTKTAQNLQKGMLINMELLIVTGLSGAGKSQVANVLEDIGYFCTDNIPPSLLPRFVSHCAETVSNDKFAAIMDMRSGSAPSKILDVLDEVKQHDLTLKVMFLDAESSVLVRRYKETRRRHPLLTHTDNDLLSAITLERELLSPIKAVADYVMDTSVTSANGLKEQIYHMFATPASSMSIRVVSFGFKYGLPIDSDLVFDVRCLPNPFYIADLKQKTGLEEEVFDYVMSFDEAKQFADHIQNMLAFSVPLYVKEGKSQLVISIGCTGGKHRSVTFARVTEAFITSLGHSAALFHRDIDKH